MARRLLMLNGIAVCCVILFHATGWGFTSMFFWAHRYLPVNSPDFSQMGSPSYYGLRLIEQLVQFAIPTFLFVSGYFVAFLTGRTQATLSWKVVGTRVKMLVIPYLIWSVAMIAMEIIEQGSRPSLTTLVRTILIGGANPAYYFIPLLIQFYLISPILVRLVKNALVPTLVVTAIIQLVVYLLQYPVSIGTSNPLILTLAGLFPKWFFLTRIFWFTAGIAVGFHLNNIKGALERYRKPLLAALMVLFIAGLFEWEAIVRMSGQQWIETRETLLDAVYGATFILLFLASANFKLPNAKTLEEIGSKSFGIYLVHSPVMQLVSRAMYHLAPWILAHQILLQPLLIVTGLGIPLLLMYVVSKSPVRQLYSYGFG